MLHCTTLDAARKGCQRAPVYRKIFFLVLLGGGAPALAQRTTNNAVTAADDAFGRAVGNERIGIYSTDDVRGFNPVDAGNVRIEGLYFDQVSQPSNRLIDSSAIRVGYAARGYPFPAPTGIVDLKLEKFEGSAITSIEGESDEQGNIGGSIHAKLPLSGEKLGLSFGQGTRIARIPYARFGDFNSHSVALTWRPDSLTELTLFWSEVAFRKQGAVPIIFPASGVIPRRIDRHAYFGQPWAQGRGSGVTWGGIFKHHFGSIALEAGLFRATRSDPVSYFDLLIGTTTSGDTPLHTIVADADNRVASTSGEVRISRSWTSEVLAHRVQMSVKGRQQSRDFGGLQRLQLGPTRIGERRDVAPPRLAFGSNDQSGVKQYTLGIGYDLIAKGKGSLSLAVQKSDYRKTSDFANPAIPDANTQDRPLLYSVNGTVNLGASLIAYAGTVRGLEESVTAPDRAINRGEAPPAIRSSQSEAGLRYAITPKLSLIAGVFQIRKPYYNLDGVQRFRQLGTLTNRGVEISLAGSLAPGLTIVAGNLFLDPRIKGPDVTARRIGQRPVGSFRRHSITNLDWKPQGQSAWSLDLAFDSVSREIADAINSYTVPARLTVATGTRYRFSIGKTRLLARVQVTNLFDNYAWRVSGSGGFTFNSPRTITTSLAADF